MDDIADLGALADLTPPAEAREPLLNGPKRQHFLPRFYLAGFCRGELLAVYDRDRDEVRHQKPEATGVIGHFYTFEDDQGRKRYEVEQILAEQEAKAAPIIRKLVAKQSLTDDERCDLAIFIALGMCRTPDHIDSIKAVNGQMIKHVARVMFSDLEHVKEIVRRDKTGAVSDEALEHEAKALIEFAHSDAYNVQTDPQWALGMAMEMHATIAPILAGRDWHVQHRESDKHSFITSDSPCVLTTVAPRLNKFYGVGVANSDALVIFPLSESCTLMMFGHGGDFRHGVASGEEIRWHNLMVAERCQRFLIGRDAALVGALARHLGLGKRQWRPKMRCN